jgi:glutaredoxin 3
MARVTVYTTDYCPYCVQAKRLLTEMAIEYEEVDVGADIALRTQMVERAGGRRTVPQIFIDGESIGGYAELRTLADTGGLGRLTS